jgi:hypothetical protein
VPEHEFSTPVLLEGTYPPAIFINMQRDSSEWQQRLDGRQLRLMVAWGWASLLLRWFGLLVHDIAAEQMPQPMPRQLLNSAVLHFPPARPCAARLPCRHDRANCGQHAPAALLWCPHRGHPGGCALRQPPTTVRELAAVAAAALPGDSAADQARRRQGLAVGPRPDADGGPQTQWSVAAREG